MKYPLTLTVNDERFELEVEANRTLLDVLRGRIRVHRHQARLWKWGMRCLHRAPGGRAGERLPDSGLAGRRQERGHHRGVEQGWGDPPDPGAFITHGAIQCGFCTPGHDSPSKALLDRNPKPKEVEIREALAGNFCRCTGYQKICGSRPVFSRQIIIM